MKFILVLLSLTAVIGGLSQCAHSPVTGGYAEASVKDEEVVAAARFAIKSASRNNQSLPITLIEVTKAEEQVVAGKNYRLELKVKAGEEEKTAEAVVWWQAWRKPEPYHLTSWQWR